MGQAGVSRHRVPGRETHTPLPGVPLQRGCAYDRNVCRNTATRLARTGADLGRGSYGLFSLSLSLALVSLGTKAPAVKATRIEPYGSMIDKRRRWPSRALLAVIAAFPDRDHVSTRFNDVMDLEACRCQVYLQVDPIRQHCGRPLQHWRYRRSAQRRLPQNHGSERSAREKEARPDLLCTGAWVERERRLSRKPATCGGSGPSADTRPGCSCCHRSPGHLRRDLVTRQARPSRHGRTAALISDLAAPAAPICAATSA